MHKYKFPGIIWTTQIVLSILMITIMCAGVAVFGTRIVDNARNDYMASSVDMVGRSLVQYAEAHRQVLPKDVELKDKGKDTQHVYAPTRPRYPKDQDEFRKIRTELGYGTQFSMKKSVDDDIYDKIRYTTNSDQTDFKLEITYPNGQTYSVTKADFMDNGRADPDKIKAESKSDSK